MKKSFLRGGIILIIASAFTWQCIGAWQDSQTTDEAVHLAAGRSYWQTVNFFLNPEHPALFKLWAALPLALAPRTQIDTATQEWRDQNQWTVGAHYLYYGSAQYEYGGRFLLFIARLQMIWVWLAFIITLTVLAWRRWGAWPALVVSAMAAYDPNLLGHGHLVTNDVATAFAYLATFLTLQRFLIRPNWKTLGLLCVVFAIAQLTKFSAVVLWGLVPLVMVIGKRYRLPGSTWRWIGKTLLGFMIVTSLMTWMVYFFRIDKISNDPRIGQLWSEQADIVRRQALHTVPSYTQFFVRLAEPSSVTGKILESFQHVPIPSYWYWRGLFSAASHNVYGHGAYLLGHVSIGGWWYYFPVALAVKTPALLLVTVLLCIVLWSRALYCGWRSKTSWRVVIPFDFWILAFPPLIYLLWSMTSHINIGVRHVFPTYIFFPLAAGSLIAMLQRYRQRLVPLVASVLTVGSILVTSLAWPNTIGYVNGIFGGTSQGHRYVLDSNMDWNQDIWRLQTFLKQHNFSEVHLALFGSIPAAALFPNTLAILSTHDVQTGAQPTGIIIISQGQLYNVDGPFAWLRPYTPKWKVGSSINIYDFR